MSVTACCNEHGCKRRKPLLIRQGSLSGTWYLVTDYTRDGDAVVAKVRHDVTLEVKHSVIATVLEKVEEVAGREVAERVAASFDMHRKKEAR